MMRWLFIIGFLVLIVLGAWPIVQDLIYGTNITDRKGSLSGGVDMNKIDRPDVMPAEPEAPELPEDSGGMFN